MMKQKLKILYTLLAASALLWATACDVNNGVESPVMDCEVLVNVRIASSEATKALPDPGTDHGERDVEWENMTLYLVYDNGVIVEHSMSRAEYEQGVPHQDELNDIDEMDFTVLAFSGTIQSVYAVAYGAPQTSLGACNTLSDIASLKTLPLNALEFNNSPSERKRYMNSLFSGSSKNVNQVVNNMRDLSHISVTLNRLVAKIDVQYDVQGAYDNGKYTEAVMSAITFRGVSQGWFFPGEAVGGNVSETVMELAKIDDTQISGRNGRAYFYALPSKTAGNEQVEFSVTYTKSASDIGVLPGGTYPYVVTFDKPLSPASWQWMRFDVKGEIAGATTGNDNHITLTVPGN